MITWVHDNKPTWETNLEKASESVVEETGLSREQLQDILNVLYEHRVIN